MGVKLRLIYLPIKPTLLAARIMEILFKASLLSIILSVSMGVIVALLVVKKWQFPQNIKLFVSSIAHEYMNIMKHNNTINIVIIFPTIIFSLHKYKAKKREFQIFTL